MTHDVKQASAIGITFCFIPLTGRQGAKKKSLAESFSLTFSRRELKEMLVMVKDYAGRLDISLVEKIKLLAKEAGER